MKDLKKVMVVALIGTVAFFAQDALEVFETAIGGWSMGYTIAAIAVLIIGGLMPKESANEEKGQRGTERALRQVMGTPVVAGFQSRVGRSSIDMEEMAFFDTAL